MQTNTTSTPPKLLDQVRDKIRFKHYSLSTEKTYIAWIKQFILYHQKRHPLEMGALEVEAFLTYLATQRHVSSACISEASYTTLDCYQLHEMDYVAPFNTAMISLHPVFFYKPAIRNFLLGGKYGVRSLIINLFKWLIVP